MQHTYFVPRNTTKLATRGGTSPDGVEMTLIRERKSTHRLGTRLDVRTNGRITSTDSPWALGNRNRNNSKL